MKEECKVIFRTSGDVLTAAITGEVDHHGARRIRTKIDEEVMTERPRGLVLDLSRVSFMDSSGIGLILGRFSKASEMGMSFAVSNPSDGTKKILDLAGMDRIVRIVCGKYRDERGEKAV